MIWLIVIVSIFVGFILGLMYCVEMNKGSRKRLQKSSFMLCYALRAQLDPAQRQYVMNVTKKLFKSEQQAKEFKQAVDDLKQELEKWNVEDNQNQT
ncbi:hypothetical protein LCGC14_0392100 [marine sediment metagenome]|uniref:Uncharacterized protein n=1 Tax=marine sediment metagenome TaxID=412755 RepID=A0A0F9VLC6_9ZZZZ